MPGMSGNDMSKVLLTKQPGMPVLYMSGYTDDAIVQHGVLEPGINFLQKPFSPGALASKVARGTGRQKLNHPQITQKNLCNLWMALLALCVLLRQFFGVAAADDHADAFAW